MSCVQENYAVVRQEAFADENVHNFPRCSTPITDSQALYLPQEKPRTKNWEKSREYNEWKNRLEREKSSRIFKLRGKGKTPQYWCSRNCSMISGYFEPIIFENRMSEETIARPAPIYHQMWLPISYPAFWNNCQHQNQPVWYKTPIQQPHQFYQTPPPVFGASGEAAFLNILNNANYHSHNHNHHHHHNFHHGMQSPANYCPAEPQPMQQCNPSNYPVPMTTGHIYYQYHYPAQFFTYSSEIPRMMNYVNVPSHGGNVLPVMMNS